MNTSFKTVRNPLTIIAIFASVAEGAATYALSMLDKSLQEIFLWYVMLFPTVLVILFFVTLWSKPRALYGPSDYVNEEHFVRLMIGSELIHQQIVEIKKGVEETEAIIENDNVKRVKEHTIESVPTTARSEYGEKLQQKIASLMLHLRDTEEASKDNLTRFAFLTETKGTTLAGRANIWRLMRRATEPLTISDVCKATGLPKEFVHKVVKEMEAAGVIQLDGKAGGYISTEIINL